jgi:hypothetical protein
VAPESEQQGIFRQIRRRIVWFTIPTFVTLAIELLGGWRFGKDMYFPLRTKASVSALTTGPIDARTRRSHANRLCPATSGSTITKILPGRGFKLMVTVN